MVCFINLLLLLMGVFLYFFREGLKFKRDGLVFEWINKELLWIKG